MFACTCLMCSCVCLQNVTHACSECLCQCFCLFGVCLPVFASSRIFPAARGRNRCYRSSSAASSSHKAQECGKRLSQATAGHAPGLCADCACSGARRRRSLSLALTWNRNKEGGWAETAACTDAFLCTAKEI